MNLVFCSRNKDNKFTANSVLTLVTKPDTVFTDKCLELPDLHFKTLGAAPSSKQTS